MAYLILFLSLVVVFLLTRIEPVRDWSKCVRTKPGISILLIVLFAVLFLGDSLGAQGELAAGQLAIPSGIRLIRFLVLVVLFFIIALKLMERLTAFRYAGTAAKYMLLYALIAMVSASYSVNALISLWKGFEVFVFVLAGIYIASGLKRWEDLRWLNNTLMMLMLFFVVSAMLGVVLVPGQAFIKSEFASTTVIAGVAPQVNPNTLTQFSTLLVVMLLAYVLNAEERKGRVGAWLIIALATAVMLLAHSRTSIFAGIFALGGILYFGRRKGLAILLAIGGTLAFTLSEVVLEYILRGQSQEVFTSLTGRTHFWEGVWKVYLESPIIGYGFYAHRTLMITASVDNTYLSVLLSLGIVGFAIFVVPIVIVAMQLLWSIPNKTQPKAEKILWLQLMSLFVLLVVRSTTGPSFQDMHPNLIMFMMLLIGVQAYRRLKNRPLDVKDNPDKILPRAQREIGRVLQRKARIP